MSTQYYKIKYEIPEKYGSTEYSYLYVASLGVSDTIIIYDEYYKERINIHEWSKNDKAQALIAILGGKPEGEFEFENLTPEETESFKFKLW